MTIFLNSILVLFLASSVILILGEVFMSEGNLKYLYASSPRQKRICKIAEGIITALFFGRVLGWW